jgi:hypothetical protein
MLSGSGFEAVQVAVPASACACALENIIRNEFPFYASSLFSSFNATG